MKSTKTTLAAIVAGGLWVGKVLVTAYEAGTFKGEDGINLVIGIALVLLGAYAKDHNVTGGSIQQ